MRNIEPDCPEKWLSHQHRYFKRGVDVALGTWFSIGLGSSGLTVWFDLTGLLQPEQFHDSVYTVHGVRCKDLSE